MAGSVRMQTADLAALLDAVEAATRDGSELHARQVLRALAALLPCDAVSWRRFDEIRRRSVPPHRDDTVIRVNLPRPGGEPNQLTLVRGPGRGFDERDHVVLRLLRPHLAGALSAIVDGTASPLTARERQVLALVASGMSNREVAGCLVVSVSTVRKHLENAYARLGVHSRTQALARYADEPDGPVRSVPLRLPRPRISPGS